MNNTRRALSLAIIFALLLSFASGALGAEVKSGDIVILATNDVHCGVDTELDENGAVTSMGYANLAAYVTSMRSAAGSSNVTLIDAGDAVQGEALGTLSSGMNGIELMNALGYDLAVVGNHEFDFGLERFFELREAADFPYLAANFVSLDTGAPVLDAYKIISYGGTSVAYVGIATPECLSKASPVIFQDGSGSFVYGFCQGDDGQELYKSVQSAVDAARAEGADYVVAVSHLGVEEASAPWRSTDVIKKTTGIDAVIDGHSHDSINESHKNASGKDVPLLQAGTKLEAISKLVIHENGEMETELVEGFAGADAAIATLIAGMQATLEGELSTVIATSKYDLVINDPATGGRIVRSRETNLGNLVADAYRVMMGADIGIVNGGGVRGEIKAGDITYGDLISVQPYGNGMCLVETSGQTILDALEHAASECPGESAGFLHVSGLSYTIDTYISSSVVTDDNGAFVKVEGDRRVKDVTVAGKALDPEAVYTLASHSFLLKSGGDGFSMFAGDRLLMDETYLDNQLLIDFITDELGGVVGELYAEPYGSGRITILGDPVVTGSPFKDISESDWFYRDVIEAAGMGLVNGVTSTSFYPRGDFSRAMLTTILYRMDGMPELEFSSSFNDVEEGQWYSDAVSWAASEGLVTGYVDGSFAPGKAITREELVTVLYRYAQSKNYIVAASDDELSEFTDTADIAAFALPAMRWAVSAKLVQGTESGKLAPKGTANRAQGAVLLLRMANTSFEYLSDLSHKISKIDEDGSAVLSLEAEPFMESYAYGDIVTVTMQDGRKIQLPFVTAATDVDEGEPALIHPEGGQYLRLSVNGGSFAADYALRTGGSVDIELHEKGGYYEEYISRQSQEGSEEKPIENGEEEAA